MRSLRTIVAVVIAAGLALCAGATAPAHGAARAARPSPEHPTFGWTTHTLAQTRTTERNLDVAPGALGAFADFRTPFPESWAREAKRRDIPLIVSWEPWDWSAGSDDQPKYSLARVAAGDFDEYARTWAKAAAKYGSRIIVRFAPEMNGDWQVWNKGDTPADFIRAWRHLHRLFERSGAGKVQWAFTPISTWVDGPAYRDWWPGAAFVDWLGVDGYQWVGVLPGRVYASAEKVFGRSVAELRALDGHLPIMVPETAAATPYKAKWLTDIARTAPALGVSMVLWFEYDKETDWRLTSQSWPRPVGTVLADAGWAVPTPTPAR